MGRLNIIVTTDTNRPWFAKLSHTTGDLATILSTQCCGAQKDGYGHWLVPHELVETFVPRGFEDKRILRPLVLVAGINPLLHQYQQEAVARATAERVLLCNFEMGLGKTPTSIETLRLTEKTLRGPVLVTVPALVRRNWVNEFARWWPGHPLIYCAESAKQAAKWNPNKAPILVISYDLATSIPATLEWGAIIADESHYIKNENSRRSKALRTLYLRNPQALKNMLTGTAITSEPPDLWHQLDCLRPGSFGDYWRFVRRYSLVSGNQYGSEAKGLNETFAPELAARLKSICVRVTKQEVAHLLPPFSVQSLMLPPVKSVSPRELLDRASSGLRKQHELDNVVAALGDTKVGAAVDQVEVALDGGATHVCVLTHFRSTAEKIANALSRLDVAVIRVDGDIPIKQRLARIDDAKNLPRAVLVATMHSINVGIDLTRFTVAVFAELYWQPAAMIQALGRFSRLSGKLPSQCYLLVRQGSLDEPIAYTLLRRVKDQAALFKPGQAEAGLAAEFDPANMREEDFIESLREAAASRRDEEYL